MKEEEKNIEETRDENPPLFKTWKSWYILVISNLVILIILFYLFTKFFE